MSSGGKQRVLYLMGPGRSGTTILAAVLAGHPDISWHGELIHLANWDQQDSLCSCGLQLSECDFWKSHDLAGRLGPSMLAAKPLEQNSSAVLALFNPGRFPDSYREGQGHLVRELGSGASWLLDSSKWVGRAIGLGGCADIDARYIYLVRDPRGVMYSFSKAVQTPRGLVSACIYYWAVNLVAQLAAWIHLKDRCLKLRYEDFLDDPAEALSRVGRLLDMEMGELSEKVKKGETFDATHAAGGNRWVKEGGVTLRAGDNWRKFVGPVRKSIVYMLCLPFQLLNGYGFR